MNTSHGLRRVIARKAERITCLVTADLQQFASAGFAGSASVQEPLTALNLTISRIDPIATVSTTSYPPLGRLAHCHPDEDRVPRVLSAIDRIKILFDTRTLSFFSDQYGDINDLLSMHK